MYQSVCSREQFDEGAVAFDSDDLGIVDFADLDGNLLISNDRFEGMTVVKGKITLPDRPGIGIIPLKNIKI